MQIKENWTDIEGEVHDTQLSDISEDFVKVKLKVAESKPVKGFADLIEASAGQMLTVEVPKDAAANLKKGTKMVSRIRRATNKNIFAHPDKTKAVKS